MSKWLRDLLTEADGVTYDIVRLLAVLSIFVGLGLSIYSVVIKGQVFSLQDFGIGVGAVFLAVGAALKLGESPAATTTEVKITKTEAG